MEKNTGLTRIIKAGYYSLKGMHHAFKYEAAFRQELLLACIFIPLACYLDTSTVERILMISSIVLVIIVELLNSAVEAVVDRIGFELHELAGRAKDLGSAAVFVALGLAIYVWLEVLLS
nr:diacylglycerol kinase [Motilimonas pumila]